MFLVSHAITEGVLGGKMTRVKRIHSGQRAERREMSRYLSNEETERFKSMRINTSTVGLVCDNVGGGPLLPDNTLILLTDLTRRQDIT